MSGESTITAGPGIGIRLSRVLRRWWSLNVVRGINHTKVSERVFADAGWSGRYAFMITLSAGIAVLGLLLSSPAVVIGAMLISPLMAPIMGLGFGLAEFSLPKMRRSAKALAIGSSAAITFCVVIVLLSPLKDATTEIAARTRPTLFDLLVAIFSALAGSYAAIRGRGETVVGVAIATALMPPLAVVGYGLAVWNMSVFAGALALFATNLFAIALTTTIMARLYGFGRFVSERATRVQAATVILVFLGMTIPLLFSLQQIADETITRQQVRSAIAKYFGQGSRVSQLDLDFGSEPLLARAVVLTPGYRGNAQARLEPLLESETSHEIELQLSQIVVAGDDSQRELQELRRAVSTAAAGGRLAPEGLPAQLSVIGGAGAEAVVIDAASRRATVRPRPLAGATLMTWRELESRLRADHPGWAVDISPPLGAIRPIPFDAGEATIRPDARRRLDALVWALGRWGVTAVEVVGRTSSIGDGSGRAADLARRRAEAVVEVLRGRGIAAMPVEEARDARMRQQERLRGLEAFRSVEVRPRTDVEPEETEAPAAVEAFGNEASL